MGGYSRYIDYSQKPNIDEKITVKESESWKYPLDDKDNIPPASIARLTVEAVCFLGRER